MVIFSCIVIVSGIVVFKSNFHWCRLWGDPNEVHSFSVSSRQLYISMLTIWIDFSAQCLLETNGWPLQLLSVACLSLAAKMKELLVPSLLDIHVFLSHLVYLLLIKNLIYLINTKI
ncbi:hypothetical protein GIB67_032001 [Kingdonia uniflora]|uniref:Cyclin N-terminal domain-containing protein n=1 Tax=Kingdonia uniflora TaxID=39325 RepID=A0A7J7MWT2_9MAGN|nr:hypothetical protein GIB67_032001 [Kingdonia uniflora]